MAAGEHDRVARRGIQYQGSTSALGYAGDWALMQRLRTLADVVIMGATTVREYGTYPTEASKLAIVSRSLRLDFDGPLFTEAPSPPVVITCGAAPAERLREAEKRAEVIVCGGDSTDMGMALQRLADKGYRRQLCEEARSCSLRSPPRVGCTSCA